MTHSTSNTTLKTAPARTPAPTRAKRTRERRCTTHAQSLSNTQNNTHPPNASEGNSNCHSNSHSNSNSTAPRTTGGAALRPACAHAHTARSKAARSRSSRDYGTSLRSVPDLTPPAPSPALAIARSAERGGHRGHREETKHRVKRTRIQIQTGRASTLPPRGPPHSHGGQEQPNLRKSTTSRNATDAERCRHRRQQNPSSWLLELPLEQSASR